MTEPAPASSPRRPPARPSTRPPPRRNAEETVIHTRILRCMLAADDCYAYWREVELDIPLGERAARAFERRWFGTKSEARVRTLVTEMTERFDAYPEALSLLHALGPIAARLRPWLCHLHVQLADPIYRRFTGELLPSRRAEGYTTIDRPFVSRWIDEIEPDRWSAATCNKFASNLIATALEVGLISGRRDPRELALAHVPGEVIGYALYLLRGVSIATSLLESPYLRSLGQSASVFVGASIGIPGISSARMGDHVDITFEEPSLGAWGQRYLEAVS